MVMITVVNRQLTHIGIRELSDAATADPRIHFQRTLAITLAAGVRVTTGIGNDAVKFVVIELAQVSFFWL